MITLLIQLFGRFGANLGSNVELEFSQEPTIHQIILKLIEKDPSLETMLLKNDQLRSGTILLINGHLLPAASLNTMIKSTDQVTVDQLGFLEIVGGG